jgi:hypothetical protein
MDADGGPAAGAEPADPSQQVVLEEEYDANYEPTAEGESFFSRRRERGQRGAKGEREGSASRERARFDAAPPLTDNPNLSKSPTSSKTSPT